MQIRLTVLGRGAAGGAVDVQITAPADTPLDAVLGSLAATATPGAGAPAAVYCEDQRLDPRHAVLGEPPLVEGAVLAFHQPLAAPRPPAEAARLLVVAGPDAGGVHLLLGGEVRIGRSSGADVALRDPDVSRLHCALTLGADGTVTVTDLGSTNGTQIDGRPVTAPATPIPPGAQLRVGESTLRVVPPGTPARPGGPQDHPSHHPEQPHPPEQPEHPDWPEHPDRPDTGPGSARRAAARAATDHPGPATAAPDAPRTRMSRGGGAASPAGHPGPAPTGPAAPSATPSGRPTRDHSAPGAPAAPGTGGTVPAPPATGPSRPGAERSAAGDPSPAPAAPPAPSTSGSGRPTADGSVPGAPHPESSRGTVPGPGHGGIPSQHDGHSADRGASVAGQSHDRSRDAARTSDTGVPHARESADTGSDVFSPETSRTVRGTRNDRAGDPRPYPDTGTGSLAPGHRPGARVQASGAPANGPGAGPTDNGTAASRPGPRDTAQAPQPGAQHNTGDPTRGTDRHRTQSPENGSPAAGTRTSRPDAGTAVGRTSDPRTGTTSGSNDAPSARSAAAEGVESRRDQGPGHTGRTHDTQAHRPDAGTAAGRITDPRTSTATGANHTTAAHGTPPARPGAPVAQGADPRTGRAPTHAGSALDARALRTGPGGDTNTRQDDPARPRSGAPSQFGAAAAQGLGPHAGQGSGTTGPAHDTRTFRPGTGRDTSPSRGEGARAHGSLADRPGDTDPGRSVEPPTGGHAGPATAVASGRSTTPRTSTGPDGTTSHSDEARASRPGTTPAQDAGPRAGTTGSTPAGRRGSRPSNADPVRGIEPPPTGGHAGPAATMAPGHGTTPPAGTRTDDTGRFDGGRGTTPPHDAGPRTNTTAATPADRSGPRPGDAGPVRGVEPPTGPGATSHADARSATARAGAGAAASAPARDTTPAPARGGTTPAPSPGTAPARGAAPGVPRAQEAGAGAPQVAGGGPDAHVTRVGQPALRPPRKGIVGWALRIGRGGRAADAAEVAAARAEAAAADARWPDPAAILLAAVEGDPLLWARDGAHPDAFTVRLGTVQQPAGPLLPVTLALPEAGSLALTGPRERLTGLARGVLAQLAALHDPGTLRIVVLADGGAREWSWLGWLPHLRPARGENCRLLVGFDPTQIAARLRELVQHTQQSRQIQQARHRQDGPGARQAAGVPASATTPRTVVLIDGDPGSPAAREAAVHLAAEGPAAGIHLLVLADTAGVRAPVACATTGVLSDSVTGVLHLTGPDGAARPPVTADAVSRAWAERFARALAPLGERAESSAAPESGSPQPLPDSVRLLDVLALPRVTPAALRERWARRSGLPLVLGLGGTGPVEVDLAAFRAPLMISGPPGSGRTELLCSLAVSLAAGAGPDALSLLLIEGSATGGGLRPAAELPQVAGHLAATDPMRMRSFAQDLRAELKRRALLLGEDGTFGTAVVAPRPPADDGSARAPRTVHDAPSSPPSSAGQLPRLVVLADDLDLLLTPPLGAPGRPAAGSVIRVLEAIAREGHRLGVHLIAAGADLTEAPGGGPLIVLGGSPAGRGELRAGSGALPATGVTGAITAPPATGTTGTTAATGPTAVTASPTAVTAFQAGRVTGRIPRTATLRPTVTRLDWSTAGDPPARRPVKELGNGPTDIALLASAAVRAGRNDTAGTASLV
ncbi:FtsK/SpoIIIE domain-containing protein [Streptomyces harbinensis]|uniref:FtsK/SpoIIIE domain-containing protein n=1 Tax=Streptomyces harbinensis TaxID=1176198 RepID=UPI003393749F